MKKSSKEPEVAAFATADEARREAERVTELLGGVPAWEVVDFGDRSPFVPVHGVRLEPPVAAPAGPPAFDLGDWIFCDLDTAREELFLSTGPRIASSVSTLPSWDRAVLAVDDWAALLDRQARAERMRGELDHLAGWLLYALVLALIALGTAVGR